jgi:glycosyltransferase involved in cell wall biosynthesis
MRERLISRGIDAMRINIIANWADVVSVTPRPPNESITRQRIGLGSSFVVGYSGNLGRAHEFETLRGAARLLRFDPRITFLITGGGAKAAGLRRAAEQEGLCNFVFQDYQPAHLLSDSLAASDVHLVSLLPALEGLIVPSKIYGILAAGRPALFIGDSNGDVGRLLREQECGISVPVGESEQLASVLLALVDDPTRLESMGRRARNLAVTHHSSEHAAADWLGLLARVAPQTVSAVTAEPTTAGRITLS